MTEREALIVRLWRQGASSEEIGSVVDLSGGQVRKTVARLRTQGVDLPSRSPGDASRHEPARLGTPYEQMLAGTWEKVA